MLDFLALCSLKGQRCRDGLLVMCSMKSRVKTHLSWSWCHCVTSSCKLTDWDSSVEMSYISGHYFAVWSACGCGVKHWAGKIAFLNFFFIKTVEVRLDIEPKYIPGTEWNVPTTPIIKSCQVLKAGIECLVRFGLFLFLNHKLSALNIHFAIF